MERRNVDSTMIRSIGHDSTASVLEIEFISGPIWQYRDFPESAWHEFDSADSHWKYFHAYIKGNYSESQIG